MSVLFNKNNTFAFHTRNMSPCRN